MSLDSGMVVVVVICMMYMVLVFGLLFYVKNEWCDLLFKNYTASEHTIYLVDWRQFQYQSVDVFLSHDDGRGCLGRW